MSQVISETSIVVIDNDMGMRDLFALSLKSEGRQVFTYPYVQIDLTALKQHRPDLIILDFNEHDSGAGWAFLQMLKMDEATANIPILITTTEFHFSAEIQNYLFTRYISVVHKPVDVDTFLVLVQKTLTLANQAGIIFSSDTILPVLVVDNTEELLDTLTTVLRLEGYPVVTACNGLVALDTVSRADYCLILLDIAMPVMNGFEFLSAYNRQLRPHTPVIILSGEQNIQIQHLPSFVVDVISKPFEISEFLKLVGKYAQSV